VDVVCRRFTEDAGFTADLDAWVDDKCAAFAAAGAAASSASSSLASVSASSSSSSERSLVQTALHDEFKRMYEAKVEGLIVAHGTTVG